RRIIFPRRNATGVPPSGGFARLPHCTPSVQGATPMTRWYPYFPDLRQTRPRFLTDGPRNAAPALKPTRSDAWTDLLAASLPGNLRNLPPKDPPSAARKKTGREPSAAAVSLPVRRSSGPLSAFLRDLQLKPDCQPLTASRQRGPGRPSAAIRAPRCPAGA